MIIDTEEKKSNIEFNQTDEEQILAIAQRILHDHLKAFKELAK